jgi:hypothetical protein
MCNTGLRQLSLTHTPTQLNLTAGHDHLMHSGIPGAAAMQRCHKAGPWVHTTRRLPSLGHSQISHSHTHELHPAGQGPAAASGLLLLPRSTRVFR